MSCHGDNYYAWLGVSPLADQAEIKAAYKRLVKEHHPDIAGSAASTGRFQEIAEAYAVLGSSKSRAEYDMLLATAAPTSPEEAEIAIEPVECSICGRFTVQPRFVIIRKVITFVVSKRLVIEGIFCAKCARRESLKATLISSLFGWWGPWGPISTIFEGIRNAMGGETCPAENERLLWHNALAFNNRGDRRVAFALADQLRGAQDRDISSNAAKLIAQLRSDGAMLEPGRLKNAWARQPFYVVAQLILIGTLPAILALSIIGRDEDHTAAPQIPTLTGKARGEDHHSSAPTYDQLRPRQTLTLIIPQVVNGSSADESGSNVPLETGIGKRYDYVRDRIIAAGFMPLVRDASGHCDYSPQCRYPETEDCAETGEARCEYRFSKDGNILRILARGETDDSDVGGQVVYSITP